MKIYFAGSIRGGRGDKVIYHKIISLLKTYGTVLTEHVGDSNLSSTGEKLSDMQIHDRDMNWIIESDIVIAEVTNPSLGVGYEIAAAMGLNKKIYCLYRVGAQNKLSAMISGSKSIKLIKYNDIDILDKKFKIFLKFNKSNEHKLGRI